MTTPPAESPRPPEAHPPAQTARAPGRRTDFELLRVVGCAIVVVGHALLVFAAEPHYHVKSAETWPVATLLLDALRLSTMPLFFALAGWAAVHSLARRGTGGFVRERLARLLVPLVVIGHLTMPFIKYVEVRHGLNLRMGGFYRIKPYEGSLLEFLPRYQLSPTQWTWSHLWFLGYLLLITLALLPWLARLARRPLPFAVPARWTVYAPAVALAALVALTGGYWPYFPRFYQDWANLALFAACFGLGAVLAQRPGVEGRLKREAWGLLALALVGLAVVAAQGESLAGRLGAGLAIGSSVGAALGFAGRHPPAPSARLSYLAEASMPFYLLHHLPVLVMASLLLPLPWHPGLKVLAIVAVATPTTWLLYRTLVEPWPRVRWLLGMPPSLRGRRVA